MYLVAKPNITLLKKALGEKLGSTITGTDLLSAITGVRVYHRA